MAAKIYRLANATLNGFQKMDEVDVTATTTSSGWTLAKTATGFSSELNVFTENTIFSSNTTTPKPGSLQTGSLANAFRSANPLNGTFDTANWSIVITFRSVTTAYSGTIRARVRVYKSSNADGTSATELTSATQVGTTSGVGSTTVDTTSTVTWTPGADFTLANEYLFIAVACEIVTASGSNSADALLRTGSTSSVGTRVTTGNYTPVASLVKEHPNRRRIHRLAAMSRDRW